MKRTAALLLVIALLFSAASCRASRRSVSSGSEPVSSDVSSIESLEPEVSSLPPESTVSTENKAVTKGEVSKSNEKKKEEPASKTVASDGLPVFGENTHCYNALTADQKTLYKGIVKAAENLTLEVDSPKLPKDNDYLNVLSAVRMDHPEIFWLDSKITIGTRGEKEAWIVLSYRLNTVDISPKSSTDDKNKGIAEINDKNKQIKQVRENFFSGITENMGAYERERILHDRLVLHCRYNTDALQKPENHPNAWTIYGALVEKTAVCEGYAMAMRYLLSYAGIESILVCGNAYDANRVPQLHMWNQVKLSDGWYHLDVTWNDPVGMSDSFISYVYFNLTSLEISADHKIEDNVAAIQNCTATGFNYFKRENLLFASVDAAAGKRIREALTAALNAKAKSFHMRCDGADFKTFCDDALTLAAETVKTGSGIHYTKNEDYKVISLYFD